MNATDWPGRPGRKTLASVHQAPLHLREVWLRWRNRLLASPRFQH